MLNLIAAALAVAQPNVPADAQAQHAQHQQSGQQGHAQHGKMAKECCCKEMMEKMRSGHDMDRKQDHQEHGGH